MKLAKNMGVKSFLDYMFKIGGVLPPDRTYITLKKLYAYPNSWVSVLDI